MADKDEGIVCVVAVCKDCGKAVIYKYVKGNSNVNIPMTGFAPVGLPFSGVPPTGMYNSATFREAKPDIEWCTDCESDEPRHLCRVGAFETPGFLDKCKKCNYKFSCASSRIEIEFEGVK